MSGSVGLLKRLLKLWWSMVLVTLGTAASAQSQLPSLALHDARGDIEAWPGVQVLSDPDGQLSVQAVLALIPQFTTPQTPYANLGVRREVMWLRVPVEVPAGQLGRWVLSVDYPPIDSLKVYVLTHGVLMSQHALGDHVPISERALPTRPHAVPLALSEGRHEILLRVQTDSSMILPVRFMTSAVFYAQEGQWQLFQGVLTGVALCLAIYSLLQWLSLRDATYFFYALSIVGSTGFFFSWYGFSAQYLWPHSVFWVDFGPPTFGLITAGASLLFIVRAMGVLRWGRLLAGLMHAVALASFAAVVAVVLGLIGFRVFVLVANVSVLLMLVLIVPVAWLQARRGDKASIYLFLGWTVYAVGVTFSTALLRGLVDLSPWSHYAYQAAAMFEILMWLRVLSLRLRETRMLADRAGREREALQYLAHTDALTGLPNRRCLLLELETGLARMSQSESLAVYLLDLDGFKEVNDQYGHDVGDELLVAVGKRLRGALSDEYTLARFGGDEFVVLAPNVTSESAQQLGELLLSAMTESFIVSDRRCAVGLTVGYALAPRDGHSAAGLLRCADQAMYNGKQAGKQCVRSQVYGTPVTV